MMEFWETLAFGIGIAILAFVFGAASFQNHLKDTYEKELKTQGSVIIKLNETRLECGEK